MNQLKKKILLFRNHPVCAIPFIATQNGQTHGSIRIVTLTLVLTPLMESLDESNKIMLVYYFPFHLLKSLKDLIIQFIPEKLEALILIIYKR